MAPLSSQQLPAFPPNLSSSPFTAKSRVFSLTTRFTISRSPTAFIFYSTSRSIMEQSHFDSTTGTAHNSKTLDFPIPLSPPPPSISKEIEYSRAMAANCKSVVLKRSDIIFEDEWLVVVNKSSGVYSECLLSSIPHLLDVPAKPTMTELHLANRLDRDTSGLMVITKLHKVAAKLVKAFTDHSVKKTYIALCVGVAPKWKQISIRSGHGRSKFGLWRVYSASDIGRGLPGGTSVKEMVSSLEVLATNGHGNITEPTEFKTDSETDCLSGKLEMLVVDEKGVPRMGMDEILVRAYPQSGRTHQIRLHCQYFGIPIRGDVKYDGVHEWRGRTYEAHALHAESLSFDHPMTGSRLEFRAPLPLWAFDACQPVGSYLESHSQHS